MFTWPSPHLVAKYLFFSLSKLTIWMIDCACAHGSIESWLSLDLPNIIRWPGPRPQTRRSSFSPVIYIELRGSCVSIVYATPWVNLSHCLMDLSRLDVMNSSLSTGIIPVTKSWWVEVETKSRSRTTTFLLTLVFIFFEASGSLFDSSSGADAD